MNISIKLNEDASSSAFNKAVQTHIDAGGGESLDDAVKRILSGKNISEKDKVRVMKVKQALEKGSISREDKAYSKQGVLKKLTMAEVRRLVLEIEAEERKQVLQDLKDNMPENYILVNELDVFQRMVKSFDGEEIKPIDVESTGTDVWSDYIVGYVLSNVTTDTHYYIPTKHDTNEKQLDHDMVTEALKPIFESPEALYIGHNIGFDIQMLRNEGIYTTGELWDTMEGMYLLNENEDSMALKTLATKYLRMPSKTYGELFGQRGFHEVSDLKLATSYAAKDGDITYELYKFQVAQLQERFPTIYKYAKEIEMPLIYAVLNMEANGFVIDLEFSKEYGKELEAEIIETEARIMKVLEPLHDDSLGELNIGSPKQLKAVLEAHTGVKLEGTAEEVLAKFEKDYEVIKDILKFRSLKKSLGTYVEKIPKAIHPKTGRLMANYKQNGAKTGRFSSGGSSGNMQNQSPEAQQLFVAPEGKVWIEADFSSQEIRAVAYLSGEPVLIEGFKNNEDPYAKMASQYYKRPIEEVYKNPDGSDTKERKEMKTIWLATLYGMGSYSLAEGLGISKKEAEKFQKDLFDSMPKLSAWLENTKQFAEAKGYVWMDKMQRKRRLPDATKHRLQIPYGKYYDPEFEEQRKHNASIGRASRQSANAVVQGSSAIQTKATLIAADKVCQEREGWVIPNVIHDAVFWEIPEDFTREDAELIKRTMIDTYKWGDQVENGTDLEVMKRWGDSVKIEDWFKQKEEE